MQTLTLLRPDDMHLHLRDGDTLRHVLPHTARQMGRAVIMPNLKPPVISVADALAYRERILAALPAGSRFQPLMTLYLTDHATPALVREAKAAGIVAFKLYPAGATTNSDSGVTDLFKLLPVLEEIAAQDMRFLVHGEVTDPAIDIFDREAVFIERILLPVLNKVLGLKTVFEHITTAEAARLVCQTATTSWWAACTRTTTACPCSNAKATAKPCSKPYPVRNRTNSSSAPTPHRTRNTPKKTPAAAPACSAPPPPSSSTPKPSSKSARSTNSKPSPRKTAPASTACPRTPTPSPW